MISIFPVLRKCTWHTEFPLCRKCHDHLCWFLILFSFMPGPEVPTGNVKEICLKRHVSCYRKCAWNLMCPDLGNVPEILPYTALGKVKISWCRKCPCHEQEMWTYLQILWDFLAQEIYYIFQWSSHKWAWFSFAKAFALCSQLHAGLNYGLLINVHFWSTLKIT